MRYVNRTSAERQKWERAERRKDRRAAEGFFRMCREGRADGLFDAARRLHRRSVYGWNWLMINERKEAWRQALTAVAQLDSVSAEVQEAFIKVWACTEQLPSAVGDRAIVGRGAARAHARKLYREAADTVPRRVGL